ncbi:hypothetical protein, partial [Escherichia coli]|uniref:hypothetical protein n=1 Tax=Escherichia coli TaxID=562 RepID=UPI0032E3A377
ASAVPEALASADYVEAAEFAAQVEEVSRTVEYLQILAAGAVDRTRTRAITDAATASATAARSGRGWITGWDPDGTETLNSAGTLNCADVPNTAEPLKETDVNWPATSATPGGPDTTDLQTKPSPVVTSPADDGCRSTAE